MPTSAPVSSVANPYGSPDIGYFANYNDAVNAANNYKKPAVNPPGNVYSASGQPIGTVNSAGQTVLSDANIRENVIPATNTQYNSLVPPPTNATSTDTSATSTDPNDIYNSANFKDLYKSLYGSDPDSSIQNDPNYTDELNLISSLNAKNDAQYQATINQIQSKYQGKLNDLATSQSAQTDSIQNALYLGGSNRYAPISSSGIMSAKEKYDLGTLNELQDEEQSLIASAQNAKSAGDYQNLQKQLDLLDQKKQQKLDLAKSISASLATSANQAAATKVQSSRDTAVASLIAQGLTDPSKLLQALNTNQDGSANGNNFTAADIATSLKNLAPDNNIDKLTGNTRDFYILKESGQLPDNVSSLPEGQQLQGYLRSIKAATSAPTSGGEGGTSNNVITLAEAKANNFPLSLVGKSEQDVLNTFQSGNVPPWFIDKVKSEQGLVLSPQYIKSEWENYRQAYLSQFSQNQNSSSNNDNEGSSTPSADEIFGS